MKQSVLVALAVSLAGVSADQFERRNELLRALARRALEIRDPFGDTSSTTTMSQSSGPGGASTAGPATGPNQSGHKAGKVKQGQNQNTSVGRVNTDASNSLNGQQTGNSGGGPISGITNNAGAPMQFGESRPRLFGGKGGSGKSNISIQSNSGMGGISTGGNSGISGNNNARIGGYDGQNNGGSNSGQASAWGNQKAQGGYSTSGPGGSSVVGGGNKQKGGDASMSLDFSPTLSVPVGRRSLALEARSLELEEEYMWIQQQKRDLEQEELNARFAEPEPEYEFTYEEGYLQARSEDPEAEMFYAREADIEAEDYFQGLTARDLLSYYDSEIEYEY